MAPCILIRTIALVTSTTILLAAAEPPSDIEVFNTIRTIQARYIEVEQQDFTEAKRTFRALIREAARGLDLADLTPYQAVLIGPMVEHAIDREQIHALTRSLERAADDDTHGAAALLLLNSMHWNLPGKPYLQRFFRHPAMDETMDTWFGRKALNSLSLEPQLMLERIEDVERAILSIHPQSFSEAPSRAVVARLLEALDHPDIADDVRPQRDRIHAHLLKIARATVAKFAPAGGSSYGPEEYQIRNAIDLVEYLEGPASQSRLIGNQAPELTFEWTAGPDAPFDSLSDLKGRVVVLDFWATWCGPCVATFPKIRELQEHYADADVVIIGVTSIQGYHVPKGGRPILLKDQPDREKELMREYMEKNDITWNIAFSDGPVTDPRYDIWGIPHVTLIDAAGNVRSNGMHPSETTFEEEVRMIDELLAQAGLDTPEHPE